MGWRRDAARTPRRVYEWFDSRLGLTQGRTVLGKAFPAEDSFLLGEVALFCFLMLVLTGVFLGFFFEPSTTDVEYQGSVAQYQGQQLPEAFVSVLHITYDVPYGMFLRRMHHWAAHLFVASIGLHMLRVFFTGAYRNPREINWVVGSGLAILAMFAAYTGYALPYDEFATTATGIGYNVAHSVPVVGGLLSRVFFGGEFPTSATIPRFYFLHVLVLPALIAGLIAVHMAILVRQKHTEAPREDDVDGIDRDDDSVIVGLPAVPNQVAVSAVVFFLTLAVLSILAGFLPVHNVAEYGPNDPAGTPDLIMPDWFFMWLYGFLKLWPAWATFSVGGVEFNAEFLGGVVLSGLVFALVIVWPFIDRSEETHFTADPLASPGRTAIGVTGVVFVMIASIAGMNNILASVVGTTTDVVNPILTVALVAGPLAAGAITYAALGGSWPLRGRSGPEATADGGRTEPRTDAQLETRSEPAEREDGVGGRRTGASAGSDGARYAEDGDENEDENGNGTEGEAEDQDDGVSDVGYDRPGDDGTEGGERP